MRNMELISHHQPIKKKQEKEVTTPESSPQMLLPVWSLSISSLRGANSFKLNCCYYKGECWFQEKKYLDLDQVERDFCSAR